MLLVLCTQTLCSRRTCWYVLVAMIGRITGAAGTCIASTVGTVGTAGMAVGIPVTGAPRTSCSNLGNRTPQLRLLHQFWDFGYIKTAPSSRPTSPYSRPTIPRSHFPMGKPYVCPIAAWRLQGSADPALGRFLSRPVAGLTGPSPPPSPSGVLRRSCPECWRQGRGPRVLQHPGVPGAAPPQPSLLPSLSPLPPPSLHRFRSLLSALVRVGARR